MIARESNSTPGATRTDVLSFSGEYTNSSRVTSADMASVVAPVI